MVYRRRCSTDWAAPPGAASGEHYDSGVYSRDGWPSLGREAPSHMPDPPISRTRPSFRVIAIASHLATGSRHTEATRNAILDAAVGLLLERRSAGFSVQEVADRVGLTHRTVYRYFPTRRDLMGATAQHLAPGFAD